MRVRFVFLAAVSVLASVSCAGVGEVRTTFARMNYCPDDRVTVRRRDELEFDKAPDPPNPSNVPSREVPSPEVLADPQRNHLWDQHEAAVEAAYKGRLAGAASSEDAEFEELRRMPIYEVSGCGRRELYDCLSSSGVDRCSVITSNPFRTSADAVKEWTGRTRSGSGVYSRLVSGAVVCKSTRQPYKRSRDDASSYTAGEPCPPYPRD
jgi:hypothetical protein